MKRQTLHSVLMGLALVPLAGCMTKPLQSVREDGTYCHRIGKSYRPTLTCTTQPVPSATVDLEAKRFEPDPNALTVYVVRHRWGDAVNQVPVTVDEGTTVLTVPESFIRLRLPPGSHRVALAWEGKTATHEIDGKAGEVRFIQLAGSVWSWGSSYVWAAGERDDARLRALKSRLIADIASR